LASIDDLIVQISEPRVREQLKREWAEVRKTRQFGLVFDRHLPELVPLPKVTPKRGDLVAKKGQSLTERWRVRRVRDVALLPGLPQTLATEKDAFIVSEDHATSVLFDETAAADWLDALDGQEQITDLYVVATTKKVFNQIKTQAQTLLGHLRITEEEKRPLAEGFAANLAYFRLDFLDQDRVALKRAFREILPLLWLKAGAIGPRPELPAETPDLDFFAPPENPFAVLLDEGAMQPLLQALDGRTRLRLLFIVTDAEEAFQELSAEARAHLAGSSPALETVQLYRDYLENFLINLDPIQAAQREAGV